MAHNINFNQIPKTFAEQTAFGFGKEHFALAIICGSNVSGFIITPSHMKQLVASAQKTLNDFEKLYGIIEDAGTSGIKSPIQPDNLGPEK